MTILRDTGELAAAVYAAHRDAVVALLLRSVPPQDWLAGYAAGLLARQPAHVGDAVEPQWWLVQLDVLAPVAAATPLARLDRPDALLLAAIGLIEDDVRFGSLFAALQLPLAARRPCAGLLGWLLDGGVDDVPVRCQQLAVRGLVVLHNPDDPRSEWVPRMPVPVFDLVRSGQVVPASLPASMAFHSRQTFPPLDDLIISPELMPAVQRLPAAIQSGAVSAVVVRGMTGSGRRTLLGSVAAQLGWDMIVSDAAPEPAGQQAGQPLLSALASLAGLLPVVRMAPGPGEVSALPAVDCPLGVVIGRTGALAGRALARAATVTLGPVGAAERARIWRDVPLADSGDATQLLLPPGTLRQVAELAKVSAAAQDRTAVRGADLRAAARSVHREALERLATYLPPLHEAAPPILSPVAAAELRTLVLRCRHRASLPDAAGGPLRGTLSRGVRALFSGPSGCGKSLAARHLAARLNLDTYRVDLAAVVNKYVGETERNLEQVLARAEEHGVVLLLDEGDALMANRTDVSSANDRYANLETNFLLQRLEIFDGIVIITTNAASRIDSAFLRRIDVTVEFTPPDADQRWQIWLAHLPSGNEVSAELIQQLAQRCTLTGGQIHNAVLHATLLGLERDSPVRDEDVVAAVRREYRRSGASCPL